MIISREKVRLALVRAWADGHDNDAAVEHVQRELGLAEEIVREVVAECQEQRA